MRQTRRGFVALIALAGAAAFSADALGSAFVAWEVADVGADDVLMVRDGPSSNADILVGYPEGVTLSMTGRCTGGVRLDDIQTLSEETQREMIRSKWCEVWLDPYGTGEFRSGWVYGRYIRPV